jgi:hypothetical protein
LQFDYNHRPTSPTPSRGGSIRGSFSYLPSSGAFRFDGGLLYFRTDDWSSRITLFEKNIPYTFSFPASYGHGMRYYGVLKWKISRPLTLYLKAGSTHYFDRSTIGSGAENILGRNKGDIYCMVQYKF